MSPTARTEAKSVLVLGAFRNLSWLVLCNIDHFESHCGSFLVKGQLQKHSVTPPFSVHSGWLHRPNLSRLGLLPRCAGSKRPSPLRRSEAFHICATLTFSVL